MKITTFLLLLVLPTFYSNASSSATFPIITQGGALSFAFDGVNYLIGIENYRSPATPTPAAQMIAANGAKVGPLIEPGRSGLGAYVAFDGINYLMIWEDDGLGAYTQSYKICGQFINKKGSAVGSRFAITTIGVGLNGSKGMAFGDGKYLVTYTRLVNPSLGYIAGRIVNPDGTMGSEFRISKGFGDASDVSFDGVNFFVVWYEDSLGQEIRGRFVSPAGVPAKEISVNASPAPSDVLVAGAYDGTNYLVVWMDMVGGTGEWDVFGQLVSPSGSRVGGVIPITKEPGSQYVTSVAFDGINYMAVWVDMQNWSNWDVYGQVIGRNGALVGGKKTIATKAGDQFGFVGFANGKYLVLVSSLIYGDEGLLEKVEASYGVFVTPPARRIIGVSGNLSFGNVYTGQTATASLTITNRGNRALTVSSVTYPEGFSGDWSGRLAAGKATNVTVTFAPETTQTYSGVVKVNSDMTGGGDTINASGFGMSDELPGQICFNASTYLAEEGTKLNVYVSRIYGSSGTVSVSYMTNPKTAVAGQDYIPKSDTLTWTNSQVGSKVIKINILADGQPERAEAFQVELNNPVGTTLTAPYKATIKILGNN